MTKRILCLSRSYLSRLLPTLGQRDQTVQYLHIVQTDSEAALVRKLGGEVVLNLESLVRTGLKSGQVPVWSEPRDFRAVTGFDWSPLLSDRYLPNYPAELRLRIAGIVHEGVRALFERQRFDAFLSEPVALFITHVLFYYSRVNGVRPLLWANTYFPGHFYFSNAVDIASASRRAPMAAEQVAVLRKTVEDYVRGVIGDKAGPVYHHSFSGSAPAKLGYFRQRRGELPWVVGTGWTPRFIQLLRLARVAAARMVFPDFSDYMTAGSVREHRFYLSCLMASRSLYDAMPTEFSSANVVYPLQYEPEASLLYFSPEVIDQCSFVETVLRALPEGKTLWVKEHPNQFGALGDARWRALRKRYHNLRFVFGRQSGRELLKRCALAVTISSTFGLDALLLGRRALILGRVFFNRFSGAILVESYADLARRLNDDANYQPGNTVAANIEEMVAFGLGCYPGDPQPSQNLFADTSLEQLAAAIRVESESSCPR